MLETRGLSVRDYSQNKQTNKQTKKQTKQKTTTGNSKLKNTTKETGNK